MVTFYLIGAVIAFLLGCRLIYNDKEKDKSQYGMIAPFNFIIVDFCNSYIMEIKT